jgi:NitT/TauT family transport system permease protein
MAVVDAAPDIDVLDGLDALETTTGRDGRWAGRAWSATWPKVAALALVVAVWQAVVWSGWREEYVLPAPGTVAGELLVIVANKPSIGARLQFARELSDAPALLAYMIVILVIGIAVDTLFAVVDRSLRARRGLTTS